VSNKGKSNQRDQGRLTVAGGLCIALGLIIGFAIKRVHLGLLLGLALGLLSGVLIKRR
jgi:hypothetical protein